MRWAWVLLIGLSVSVCHAADSFLLITDSGYFHVVLGDAPQITKIEDVIDLRVTSDDGTDVPGDTLAERVTIWAEAANDPSGAPVLATIYKEAAKVVSAGELPPAEAPQWIRQQTDERLLTPALWEEFRDKVSQEAGPRFASGELLTGEGMAKFLLSISRGLRDAG